MLRSKLECLVVVIFVIFASWSDHFILPVDGKVTCYVCSWSRYDTRNGSKECVDVCTPNNFIPAAAKQVECTGGCETMAYRDAKNQPILHFHRNCVASENDRSFQDKCEDVMGKTHFEQKCECFSSLCNSSPLTFSTSNSIYIVLLWLVVSSSRASFNIIIFNQL